MKKYDYLIVGCGIFGATFAQQAIEDKKTVLIIDKRNHIGGNVYTEKINGIQLHKYGAHIFHTNNLAIWNYINRFAKFNNYKHKVLANYQNNYYSIPFNMKTFDQFWNIKTQKEAINKINSQKFSGKISNLEEQALSMVGEEIYETLIKGYTTKQWNKNPKKLPPSIIKRIPVRFTDNDLYFEDQYQGIPIGGYTNLISNMIDGCDLKLESDYFSKRDYYDSISKKIIYTGMIDEFFEFKYGFLEYRSLHFEHNIYSTRYYQSNAVINFTDINIPYTRKIEHKYFEPIESDKTIVTTEYPKNFEKKLEPYYPINDSINHKKYQKYKKLSSIDKKYVFGGRLAEYKYVDMNQAIGSALSKYKKDL